MSRRLPIQLLLGIELRTADALRDAVAVLPSIAEQSIPATFYVTRSLVSDAGDVAESFAAAGCELCWRYETTGDLQHIGEATVCRVACELSVSDVALLNQAGVVAATVHRRKRDGPRWPHRREGVLLIPDADIGSGAGSADVDAMRNQLARWPMKIPRCMSLCVDVTNAEQAIDWASQFIQQCAEADAPAAWASPATLAKWMNARQRGFC